MDNETITRLAFAAKNGNERSFEELYTAFYQKVYALARTTMKNDADAEDVLQQTFISAWTNIGKLDDPAAFNTWIQRITLNQCYSMLRKRRIDIPIDVSEFDGDDDEPMQIESDVMLPEVYAEKEDLRIRLGHIIDDLSDVQRQTIMLYYFDEMSVAEIAAAMDCSENTVKSRLFLARKAIKTEIEERERKSGERFYAIAGLPMIAFGRLFIAQVKSTLISPAAASSVISRITGHPVSVTARPDAVSARPGGSESGNLRPAGTPAPNGAGPNAARTVSSAASRVSSSVSSGAAATAAKTAGAATATAAAKGIFATLGAKIAAGVIAGAIVVGGAVTAAVVIKKAHDGKAAAGTEVEESVRSDDTDGEAGEEENYVDAYSAYLDLIVENKDELDSYDWDGEYNQLKPKGSGITMRPIVLCDVYGDKTPELIFLSVTDLMSIPTAALNIVTYEDSEIKSLYFDEHYYGTPEAGEFRPICFYQLNGDRTLRVYESSEFNGLEIAEYSEFTEQNGALVKTQTLGFLRVHGGDVNGQPEYSTSYTRYGSQITEEEFNAAVKEQEEKTQTILLSNPLNGNFVKEFTAANGSPAMTWQEAVDLLRSLIGSGQTGEKTKKTEDFSPVAGSYTYTTSGGFSWTTTLELKADGTFTGVFFNPNGKRANGDFAYYRSDFHGAFSDLRKIDDQTYSFEMTSLEYDVEVGKEWSDDNGLWYVGREAYGLENGKTFYFYKSGTPIDNVPKDFIDPIRRAAQVPDTATALPFDGIYNENDKAGFFGPSAPASANGDENAADASAGWSDAYKDFLLNEKFMDSDEYKFFEGELFETDIDSIYIGMYDVSGDGVPELFMSNQCGYFADATNYVFTVENGEVRYIGNAGSRAIWLDIDVTGAYPGVFCLSGSYGVYHCDYYTVRDNNVLWETVFVLTDEQGSLYYKEDDTYERGESERFGQIMYHKKTDDLALYECAKRAVAPEKFFTTQDPNPAILRHFSLSEIRSMGWEAFVASVD